MQTLHMTFDEQTENGGFKRKIKFFLYVDADLKNLKNTVVVF